MAVTGATGRLGRALVHALASEGVGVVEWSRPRYDLDDPTAAARAFEADRPDLVIHAAAWTDVDACAKAPALAVRRNAAAVTELAQTCAANGAAMVFVSTNEVFDGERDDGRGYAEADPPRPINPYGASKLAGERGANAAFTGPTRAGSLWIARTAWLYGPPGNDFPTKIVAAADRLPSGQPLRVVTDEIGSPSYSVDLAGALLTLIAGAPPGTYHLASPTRASRFEVAAAVLERCRPGTPIVPISRHEYTRPSNPPAWAVLDSSLAAPYGARLRPWREALDEYLATPPANAP